MIRSLAAVLALAGALTACAGAEPSATGSAPAATSAAPSSAAPSSAAPSSAAPSPSASPSAAASPADDRQLVTLSVAGGKVSGDTGRVRVPVGATVLLRVTSDVADEVHVHGVDEYVDLQPGQTVEREFVATTPGVFEVELHDAGTLLTRLQVQ